MRLRLFICLNRSGGAGSNSEMSAGNMRTKRNESFGPAASIFGLIIGRPSQRMAGWLEDIRQAPMGVFSRWRAANRFVVTCAGFFTSAAIEMLNGLLRWAQKKSWLGVSC